MRVSDSNDDSTGNSVEDSLDSGGLDRQTTAPDRRMEERPQGKIRGTSKAAHLRTKWHPRARGHPAPGLRGVSDEGMRVADTAPAYAQRASASHKKARPELRRRLASAGASLLLTAIFSTTGAAQARAPAVGEKPALPASGAASESLPQASPDDGRAYPVTEINLLYARKHSQHPDIESIILTVPVSFGKAADGLVAPRTGLPLDIFLIRDMSFEKPVLLYASGIKALCSAVVAEFNRRGFAGVFVEPDVHEIDERTGADLRSGAGSTKLDLVIYTAAVKEIRTVASGNRITDGERVNNPALAGLKSDSPLQGAGPDHPEGDLLRTEALDDYVFSLNRFPGRHVDAALSSTGVPGDVVLDLLVHEEKPWLAYAQLSNTGTKQTDEWRESAGITLTQLANDDDILSLNYTTTSFDTSEAVSTAYEFNLSRDWRLRMRPYVSWSMFNASTSAYRGSNSPARIIRSATTSSGTCTSIASFS